MSSELNKGDFDCLIGFGGGSPIDTAKAMAILAAGGGKMRDYKAPFAADKGALPVIAIPTTAGTGSECTRFTVITDTERDEKMLIAGLGALPLAALVDYELTYSVPPRTTADTGVDSLTHALEAYVSKRANPISDALALSAMALIGANIRTAYAEPRNAAAREAMMLGATEAGLAFSNSSVALGAWDVTANRRAFPCAARTVKCDAVAGDHPLFGCWRRVALRRGRSADRLCRADRQRRGGSGEADTGLEQLNKDLSVPTPSEYGIDEAAWTGKMTLMAEQALASGSPANNPKVPTARRRSSGCIERSGPARRQTDNFCD